MENLKCEKCGGEMEKGLLVQSVPTGGISLRGRVSWVSRIHVGLIGVKFFDQHSVESYKCNKCGYLESYGKVN